MPLAQSVKTTTPAVIRLAKLGKTIDDRPILRELDFEVASGEFVAILGSNGAGKSTLLKILATLTPPSSGELHLFDQKIDRTTASIRARIGMIGHQSMLYGELTAKENLHFFAKLYGVKSPSSRANEMLQTVGLLDRADDPVKAFSRGMTQRVAIARALLHDPQLLLADEPFAGLDEASSRSLEGLLSLLNQSGKTIVLVNHDVRQTLALARRVMVLRAGRKVIDALAGELTVEIVLDAMNGAVLARPVGADIGADVRPEGPVQ